MKTATRMKPEQPIETDGSEAHAPHQLSFTENAVMTVKVLVGLGLIGAAVWGIDVWTSGR